jgi:integrase
VNHRERPTKRTNPSGKTVWLARYTNAVGKRKSAGTFATKGPCRSEDRTPAPQCCAQHAIDAAYGRAADPTSLGGYAATWIENHPRSEQTNRWATTKLAAVEDVEVEGRPLREWPLADLRRKHANALVAHMLTEQGRAVGGVKGVLRALSMLAEDAIDDEIAELNFVKGVKVKANDPRSTKPAKKPTVWTFDQLREFAAAGSASIRAATPKPKPNKRTGKTLYYPATNYEPMLLVFALTGLRIGEIFALRRDGFKGDTLDVTGTAWEGKVTEGDTAEKHHVRTVPIPPSLRAAIESVPPRIDTPWLFPAPGGDVWHDSNFRRDVWEAAQISSGLKVLPHDCRHSYVSNLRAAGVDPADLAAVTGHDVETATRVYTHATNRSAAAIRAALT